MKRSRRILIIGTICFFLGMVVFLVISEPEVKIVDRFKVRFDSAKYDTSRTIIHSSEDRREKVNEYLRLNCQVDIADTDLVLGISRKGIITQLKNDKGEIVEGIDQRLPQHRSFTDHYSSLRYRRQFVRPKKLTKWETFIQQALITLRMKRPEPRWVEKLEPSRIRVELDSELFDPNSEKISRIEGHFHVLMAESLENIDIPFKPTEEFVRIIPGYEIKVLEAQTTESGYRCRIEGRPEEGGLRGSISPDANLPERFVVKQQLIGKDGKPTRSRNPLTLRLPGYGTSSSGGSGSRLGNIKKIRFLIAVNPNHHKIPFVLEDIPLPSRDAVVNDEKTARTGSRSKSMAQVVPYSPIQPLSKTIHRQTWMKLSWEPKPDAVSYDVYLGESFEDVNDGTNNSYYHNQTDTNLIVGFPGMPYPDGLVPGQTYYWTVDEVYSNSQRRGEVRSFSIAPKTAFNPFPADGAKSVDPNVTLRWAEGLKAKLHRVYFGDDLETVTNATGGSPQVTKTFEPGKLVPRTTYYWRVDEFDPPDTYKGKVWSFTVKDAAESQQISD